MDSRTARRSALAITALLALAAATASSASAQPDLVISRVSYQPIGTAEGVVGAGATLRISERTRNTGSSFARKSTTRYFLDDQPLRSLGRRSVEALAPGDSAARITDVTFPRAIQPGTYRVIACADGAERIRERSERNNCRAASGNLRVRANQRDAVFIGGGAATGAIVAIEGVPTLLAPRLTVTDADDTELTGATVRIAGGARGAPIGAVVGDAGRDWFFFANQRGITGTYNSGTGVLTLRGTASIADYQSALRSVWYQQLADDPRASRKVEFRARDAVGVWSRSVRATITVTPVNDAPALAANASRIAVLDPDSQLSGATVTIGEGFASGDRLEFQDQLGITGTYNSGTGVLTLTGTASPTDYETALRSFRLVTPSGGQRTLRAQVTDAAGATSNILPFVEQQT